MNALTNAILFATSLLIATCDMSFADSNNLIEDDAEVEWAEIRKLTSIYETAASSGNVDVLAPYLATDFTAALITGEEVTGLRGLKEYNAKIREMIGTGGTYTVKVSYKPGIMVAGAALAHGTSEERVIDSKGRQFDFTGFWTAVISKSEGSWKLVRLHASMDPINNVFVKTVSSTMPKVVGTIAILAGIIIGWILRGLRKA